MQYALAEDPYDRHGVETLGERRKRELLRKGKRDSGKNFAGAEVDPDWSLSLSLDLRSLDQERADFAATQFLAAAEAGQTSKPLLARAAGPH